MSISCPLCQCCSFSHVESLIKALLTFLKFPILCPLCNSPCEDFSQLIAHLMHNCAVLLIEQTHAAAGHIDQPPCTSEVPAISPASDTLTSQTEDLHIICKQCDEFKAADFESLKLHTELSHPERKFLCTFCHKAFRVSPSLSVHLKIAHNQGAKFKCSQCDRKFGTKYRKDQHEKTHEESLKKANGNGLNKKLGELHAGKPGSPNEINHHQNPTNDSSSGSQQGKSLFSCSQCGKTFKREHCLIQHAKTHDPKKCQCPVCHKSFTSKEYLKKHSRLHTGETPYSCDICGKTFTLQQSYHKHVLYHSDDRPYVCSFCGRKFKELTTLHNHERIHTGEKPYACETCGKSFRQRVSYVVHRRIHTGALPYLCTACGKSFRYKVSQRTHKCPSETQSSVVRCRPPWLERLLHTQQNESRLVEPAANPPDENDQPSASRSDSDFLHTIDLSSLTLTFDQDLNF